YFFLKGTAPSAPTAESPARPWETDTWRRHVRTVEVACDTLEEFARRHETRSNHLVGLAQLWNAYARRLDGAAPQALEQLVRSALAAFDDATSAPDRHDTLLLLAEIVEPAHPAEAATYVDEARRIREALQRQ